MKKSVALLICLALLVSMISGCAAKQPAEPDAKPEPEQDTVPEDTEPAADDEEPSVPDEEDPSDAPDEPSEETEPDLPDDGGETEHHGHYTFKPKVCSSYMTDVFGETMVETWYAFVDAVMAGEDTFACPDQYTYDWVMGQFPDKCFPAFRELVDYAYDRGNCVHDGVASFTYLVPKEELQDRIAEFAALVEGILNETLEDDYSDLEKALALYLYFADNYIYDYEAAEAEGYQFYLSSYRVLTTGLGICQEFSVAYSYLLLQAGVDASTMSGHRGFDHEGHQWSYVNINGHNFHIDPTYVLGGYSLSYFMMNDDQREAEDGYSRDDYTICSHYSNDNPHKEYTADDDTFRDIWGGYFVNLDHRTHTLYYEKYFEAEGTKVLLFDYTGW